MLAIHNASAINMYIFDFLGIRKVGATLVWVPLIIEHF